MTVLAIEVEVNGKRLAVAGAKDLSVLSAGISATGLLGPDTFEFRKSPNRPPNIHLRAGGLTSRKTVADEHLNWVDHLELKPGDTVTLRLVEVENPDAPTSSSPAADKSPSADQRAYFKMLEEQYLRLRTKYKQRGLTARSRPTRRKRRAAKRGR
jgi:hypothetical protein